MTTTLQTHPADHRYDALRAGFNRAVEHRPAAVVDAVTTADLVAAVRTATAQGLAVAVMNTGHGPSVGADDAILVRTGRLRGVAVDPDRRTAVVQAGAAWGDVIAAAAPYGLAPLNGSSPHVGAVGYTLGGGVGPLGRRFGFAADHVRWFDAVTADGRLRHVDATGADRELFWALRGAGANFGVVAAMEIDLFPVARLYGGELGYGADVGEEVLHLYASWAQDVPETMSSSVMLLRYPDDDAVPAPLRGRHITHVRIADSGDDHRAAQRLVAPLRRLGPVVDTVRSMPYADVGSIHHEPTDQPVVAFDRNELLHTFDDDAASMIAKFAGPAVDAPYMVEIRAWGGALARPPSIPNAVGTRQTAFSLLAISDASTEARAARDGLLAAMEPWATGMTYLNFSGVEQTSPAAVARNYLPEDLARLHAVKAAYDPRNVFRVNFNITSTTDNDRSPR
jgi:FAD/FMN-containing dehydrogenase